MNLFLGLLENMVLAAIPAVGFGLVFNVPRHALLYCALGGALGRGGRFLLMSTLDMPLAWATLLAAATVSLIGVYVAQRMRAHPKVFTVAAMIPMIPGVPIFKALIAVATMQEKGATDELMATALQSGLTAGFVVAALAIGLAVPGLLFYRRRPVV
ncbi:MAG: threonine/serine exporter family protein [Opitutaceae bacterium]|nr:threonine/serine exporter family protein [Opitutaceae bacterium]